MDGILDWLLLTAMLATTSVIAIWMAGAIYYDVCNKSKIGKPLAFVWIVGVVLLFVFWQPLWQPFVAFMGIATLFVGWWLTLKPSHNREWDPTCAVLPLGTRVGDVVTIENVRNNEYRSFDDFTPRYETLSYRLSELKGADIVFFYWGMPWFCHPILIFDFGPDGRICMSIEVRFRKGQKYAIIPSFYRQQELIFHAVDERDAIGRRTKYEHPDEAYFFTLTADVERLRIVFLDYVSAINSLHDKPRWYNALFSNCTTNFFRLPHSRFRLEWQIFLNGYLDRAMYERGQLDRSLPFEVLKRAGHLNEVAKAAPYDSFGDYLRSELEKRRRSG